MGIFFKNKNKDLSGWNSYLVNVNNEISSIFVNLDLKNKAPYQEYPKLSWYWIKMENPKENGLSSNKDFDSLIEHEDRLEAYFSKLPVTFAGRITTQGRREFYFYTTQEFNFETTIKKFVGKKAKYLFQTGEKNDKDWNQYLNLLYPSENGLNQIKEKLKKA